MGADRPSSKMSKRENMARSAGNGPHLHLRRKKRRAVCNGRCTRGGAPPTEGCNAHGNAGVAMTKGSEARRERTEAVPAGAGSATTTSTGAGGAAPPTATAAAIAATDRRHHSRLHEELKEPHCWLHRRANRSRPSVRLTSLPTKLEDTALPTGCIFLYLFLTDKVTVTELQSACPHTTTLGLCQLYEKTSPEGIQLLVNQRHS